MEGLTYAQNTGVTPERETIHFSGIPGEFGNAKSLISLNFNSCPLYGHSVGKLDFQGFAPGQARFSTKLSTEILSTSGSH
jgi:hypothetical protein